MPNETCLQVQPQESPFQGKVYTEVKDLEGYSHKTLCQLGYYIDLRII